MNKSTTLSKSSLSGITVLSLLLRNPPATPVPSADLQKSGGNRIYKYKWKEVISSGPFIILWLSYLMSAAAGLAYGSLFALFPAATADIFGIKNLGANYGLVFTGWGVAGIIGPLLGGIVADATGTYNISYSVSALMLLAGAALVKQIKSTGTTPG